MTSTEADTAYFQRAHNAMKRARSIVDESLRAAMLGDLIEMDRLHSIRLAAAHDERLETEKYKWEVEKLLKR